MTDAADPGTPSTASSSLFQALPLLLLLVTAAGLRCWNVDLLAVEHFDEGVYASNYFSTHLNNRYPDRHLYAPSLLPAVCEWALIFSNGNPAAVLWVNLVLGTALVAAVWWVARIIVGAEAALMAAALVALSDYFIEYSRAVLTETPVSLCMLLAIGCGLLTFRERRTELLLLAALLTAAAWWTKYNGWLPLAILGAGLCGWGVCERPHFRSEFLPRLLDWGLLAVAAFLFWSPYLWSLQDVGGYVAVAKNHAGYVSGWNWWGDVLWWHLDVQSFYSTGLGAGLVIGAVWSVHQRWSSIQHWSAGIWGSLAVLLIAVLLGGTIPLLLGFALLGLLPFQRPVAKVDRLNGWVLLAWIAGLLLTTPLYRPYPRLFMPLLLGLIIAACRGMQLLVEWLSVQQISSANQPVFVSRRLAVPEFVRVLMLTLVVGMFACLLPRMFSWRDVLPLYESRTAFAETAAAFVAQIREDARTGRDGGNSEQGIEAIVYVLGEPGLYYHLSSWEGRPFPFVTQPASGLSVLNPQPNSPRLPTYLVLGPHARDELLALQCPTDNVRLVAEHTVRASRLVVLDDHRPTDLEANRAQPVQLWRIETP